MSFDWREYLEVAKYLAGLQSSGFSQEASYRSAVSRAYYAAFCWCRNYAQKYLGFKSTGKPEDHKFLREHLKKIDGDWARIASKLNRLRGWRNDCDYENCVKGLSHMLKESIKFSNEVIEKCK